MATYTSDQAAAGYPVFEGPSGVVMAAYGTYEIASALSDNDIVEMCKVPANSRILGGRFNADDLDTGTEVMIVEIGTADDPNMLLTSDALLGDAVVQVKPETAVSYPLLGLLKDGPQLVTEETTFQIKVTEPANAGGTGTISLTVYYTRNVTTGA